MSDNKTMNTLHAALRLLARAGLASLGPERDLAILEDVLMPTVTTPPPLLTTRPAACRRRPAVDTSPAALHVALRMLIDYAVADVMRLELMPMSCWIALRCTCRQFYSAYKVARGLFDAYVRRRLHELFNDDIVTELTLPDHTLVGDFICDCLNGIRRQEAPTIVLVVACGPTLRLWNAGWYTPLPSDNATHGMYIYARNGGDVGHVDLVKLVNRHTSIKWVAPVGSTDYVCTVMETMESYALPCCRVIYEPASRRLYADGMERPPQATEVARRARVLEIPYNAWLWNHAAKTPAEVLDGVSARCTHYARHGLCG